MLTSRQPKRFGGVDGKGFENFGGADITQGIIPVNRTTVPGEIVITVGTVPIDSVPGVKVP